MAEDRFKNLSAPQWLFHYREVMRYKESEMAYQRKLAELLCFVTNPNLAMELLQIDKRDTINTEHAITPDNFEEKWEQMLQYLPKELNIPELGVKNRFVLPTFKRSDIINRLNGIQIEE